MVIEFIVQAFQEKSDKVKLAIAIFDIFVKNCG